MGGARAPETTGPPGGEARWLARAVPIALVAWAGFALWDFLAPGLPIQFDAHSHLARSEFAARALAEGRLPGWTFTWYGGYRLLEFYAPGYFVLTGVLGLVLGDVVIATKLVLWTGQIFIALALYGFGRRLSLSPLLAAVAPVLFVESSQRGWTLGVLGNHPSVIVSAGAAAWLCWVAGPARRSASTLQLVLKRSLVLAAMALGHLQAVLLIPGLVAFDALWLGASLGWRRVLPIVAGSLAGLALLTSFVVLPMLGDLSRVTLALEAETGRSLLPQLEPLAILAGLERFSWDRVYLRSHGLPWILLGLAGAALSLALRERRGSALAAGLAVNAAMLACVSDRAVLGIGLFLFPLCALLPARLEELLKRRPVRGATVIAPAAGLALIVWAVLEPPGRHRFEAGWAAVDALEAYEEIPATPSRSRTFDVTPHSLCIDGFYGASSAAPLVSGRSVPFGGFLQGAPQVVQLSMALLGRLTSELSGPSPALSSASLDALYLSHVQFLVDRSERPRLDRVARSSTEALSNHPGLLRLRSASPALFAPALEALASRFAELKSGAGPRLLAALRERRRADPVAGVDVVPFLSGRSREIEVDRSRFTPSLRLLGRTRHKRDWEPIAPIVQAMEIDRVRAVARRLFVDEDNAVLGAPPLSPAEIAPGALTVLAHDESGDAVRIEAHAPAPGFLRLAYAYDPDVPVRLDGELVRSVAGSLGAIVIAFPEGRHSVELGAPTQARRVVLTLACALLAAGAIALVLSPRRPS